MMTSLLTNLHSNLIKNQPPLLSHSKILFISLRREKLIKVKRNSNFGSLLETLTLSTSG